MRNSYVCFWILISMLASAGTAMAAANCTDFDGFPADCGKQQKIKTDPDMTPTDLDGFPVATVENRKKTRQDLTATDLDGFPVTTKKMSVVKKKPVTKGLITKNGHSL
jgi:hypothetical protein